MGRGLLVPVEDLGFPDQLARSRIESEDEVVIAGVDDGATPDRDVAVIARVEADARVEPVWDLALVAQIPIADAKYQEFKRVGMAAWPELAERIAAGHLLTRARKTLGK